ncbi:MULTISPECIES: deaminase [unclassified Rhizobium]|jgi:tRNA(adenine34) deaminase|uniref:nucleoside deaminase n=1 Tax=unclassified Rhizobium TaxID=2613769 RepID=UPI0006470F15|nr:MULTISPECIES: deaminase [unclassified Rhizobium]MBN8951512.1 nucleoside deaminase [Rhizobium tropici]OJY67751.1 MAG: CMP deaminase [Rhizobium sp. 60-20]RKD60226.1 tRNA(adenine34) deaminase [Rhizobium sp. WW_1]
MVQENDDQMMGLALAEAKAALDRGIFPVGAVLAAGGRILGRSHKTMASNHLNHAEMNLFHQVFMGDYRFSRDDDLTLYTTLEPCIMCFGTMLHLPITRLVFAMPDAYGGCGHVRLENSPPRHAARAVEVVGGVRRADACKLFAKFLATTTEAFWLTGGASHFQAAVKAGLEPNAAQI